MRAGGDSRGPARRAVLRAAAAGVLTAALPAFARRAGGSRIGWFAIGRAMGGLHGFESFRAGLHELGYVEGRRVELTERWSEIDSDDADRIAHELVRSRPDIIVTAATAVFSVQRAGADMPVVFAFSGDPVAAKLVDSVARPGGNRTGISFLSLELAGKRMQLLKELAPTLKRVAIIGNPQHAGRQTELEASRAAASALGIKIDYFEVTSNAELEAGLAAIGKARSEAILVFPDTRTMSFSASIARFSVQHGVPAISGWAYFAEQGNVMSYGPHFQSAFRRLATFVDRILKGAKPAEIAVELPRTFELVVNRRALQAIGIAMPRHLQVRVDRVID